MIKTEITKTGVESKAKVFGANKKIWHYPVVRVMFVMINAKYSRIVITTAVIVATVIATTVIAMVKIATIEPTLKIFNGRRKLP